MRRGILNNIVIVGSQSGGWGLAGFGVQNPRLLCKGGGRRSEKNDKMAGNSIKLSRDKRLTNFRIKSIKNLWIFKDGKIVSTEMWRVRAEVGDHPIVRIKSKAEEDVHNGGPNQNDELPIIRGDASPQMFTPREE